MSDYDYPALDLMEILVLTGGLDKAEEPLETTGEPDELEEVPW